MYDNSRDAMGASTLSASRSLQNLQELAEAFMSATMETQHLLGRLRRCSSYIGMSQFVETPEGRAVQPKPGGNFLVSMLDTLSDANINLQQLRTLVEAFEAVTGTVPSTGTSRIIG